VKRAGQVITVIFALLAFSCSFVGVAAGLDVTQPANKSANATIQFEVKPGDSTADVADRLQKAGLIRNAVLFRVLARYRKLDTKLEPGVYKLSSGMTMDAIIHTLLTGQPDEQLVTIPPGLRVTQYPKYFGCELGAKGAWGAKGSCGLLPNFDPTSFVHIAQTGVLPDGTKLSDKYWYVPPKGPNVAYALEGYLFPDTYYFNTSDTEIGVVGRLLSALGQQICPGPDAQIHDAAQCKAHAVEVPVGTKQVNIFTEMENRYFTKNDVVALYDTLIVAAITVREVASDKDAPGVAAVYYNRFLTWKNNVNNAAGDVVNYLGADPTAQYARDTDSPPADGKWWGKLADAAKNVDPNNPYNTNNPDHKGFPPGPIAAPTFQDIIAAAAASDPKPSVLYYYFFSDCTGKIWYASSFAEFNSKTIPQAQAVKC
jgi:UPF0755 protein